MGKTARLKGEITLDDSKFHAGLRRAAAAATKFASVAGNAIKNAGMIAATAGVVGLAAAFVGVGAAARKAVASAADFEQFKVSFGVILGSADAAQKRLDELSKFAASTPFDLPSVVAASQTLQTLTQGALATGKGLELVGDVAAGTGQPFSDMATTLGRLYDALQNGQPAGEAMSRLQELGAISGETRREVENLQSSGASGSRAWDTAAKALERYSGMMAKQSKTWNGLMSTFHDSIDTALRAFGTPFMESLKPALESAISFADSMQEKFAAVGRQVGEIATTILGIGKNGEIFDALLSGSSAVLKTIGNEVVTTLTAAWNTFSPVIGKTLGTVGQLISGLLTPLWSMIADIGSRLGSALGSVMQSIGAVLMDPKLWNAVKWGLVAAAKAFDAAFSESVAKVLDVIPKMGGKASALRADAKVSRFESESLGQYASDQMKGSKAGQIGEEIARAFAPVTDGNVGSQLAELGAAWAGAVEDFKNNKAEAGKPFDASEDWAKLGEIIARAQASAPTPPAAVAAAVKTAETSRGGATPMRQQRSHEDGMPHPGGTSREAYNRMVQGGLVRSVSGVRKRGESREDFTNRMDAARSSSLMDLGLPGIGSADEGDSLFLQPSTPGGGGMSRKRIDARTPAEKERAARAAESGKDRDDSKSSEQKGIEAIAQNTARMVEIWDAG